MGRQVEVVGWFCGTVKYYVVSPGRHRDGVVYQQSRVNQRELFLHVVEEEFLFCLHLFEFQIRRLIWWNLSWSTMILKGFSEKVAFIVLNRHGKVMRIRLFLFDSMAGGSFLWQAPFGRVWVSFTLTLLQTGHFAYLITTYVSFLFAQNSRKRYCSGHIRVFEVTSTYDVLSL